MFKELWRDDREYAVLILFVVIVGLVASLTGCSVDNGPMLDASPLPLVGGVRRGQEPPPTGEADAGTDTAPAVSPDTGRDFGSDVKTPTPDVFASEAKPLQPDVGRVTPAVCGQIPRTGTAGYVPCCPPGDDCKVTINPAFDYCDCAASPPKPGFTYCAVAATHYPTPEPVKQPWPSTCEVP